MRLPHPLTSRHQLGKRGSLLAAPHPLTYTVLEWCFARSHCLGAAAARATPRMLSTSLTLVFCLPCLQTTTTSCHRRSVYRPFLTRLAVLELLTLDSLTALLSQGRSLPPFSLSIRFTDNISTCYFSKLALSISLNNFHKHLSYARSPFLMLLSQC